jgi:hypothetical protein
MTNSLFHFFDEYTPNSAAIATITTTATTIPPITPLDICVDAPGGDVGEMVEEALKLVGKREVVDIVIVDTVLKLGEGIEEVEGARVTTTSLLGEGVEEVEYSEVVWVAAISAIGSKVQDFSDGFAELNEI